MNDNINFNTGTITRTYPQGSIGDFLEILIDANSQSNFKSSDLLNKIDFSFLEKPATENNILNFIISINKTDPSLSSVLSNIVGNYSLTKTKNNSSNIYSLLGNLLNEANIVVNPQNEIDKYFNKLDYSFACAIAVEEKNKFIPDDSIQNRLQEIIRLRIAFLSTLIQLRSTQKSVLNNIYIIENTRFSREISLNILFHVLQNCKDLNPLNIVEKYEDIKKSVTQDIANGVLQLPDRRLIKLKNKAIVNDEFEKYFLESLNNEISPLLRIMLSFSDNYKSISNLVFPVVAVKNPISGKILRVEVSKYGLKSEEIKDIDIPKFNLVTSDIETEIRKEIAKRSADNPSKAIKYIVEEVLTDFKLNSDTLNVRITDKVKSSVYSPEKWNRKLLFWLDDFEDRKTVIGNIISNLSENLPISSKNKEVLENLSNTSGATIFSTVIGLSLFNIPGAILGGAIAAGTRTAIKEDTLEESVAKAIVNIKSKNEFQEPAYIAYRNKDKIKNDYKIIADRLIKLLEDAENDNLNEITIDYSVISNTIYDLIREQRYDEIQNIKEFLDKKINKDSLDISKQVLNLLQKIDVNKNSIFFANAIVNILEANYSKADLSKLDIFLDKTFNNIKDEVINVLNNNVSQNNRQKTDIKTDYINIVEIFNEILDKKIDITIDKVKDYIDNSIKNDSIKISKIALEILKNTKGPNNYNDVIIFGSTILSVLENKGIYLSLDDLKSNLSKQLSNEFLKIKDDLVLQIDNTDINLFSLYRTKIELSETLGININDLTRNVYSYLSSIDGVNNNTQILGNILNKLVNESIPNISVLKELFSKNIRYKYSDTINSVLKIIGEDKFILNLYPKVENVRKSIIDDVLNQEELNTLATSGKNPYYEMLNMMLENNPILMDSYSKLMNESNISNVYLKKINDIGINTKKRVKESSDYIYTSILGVGNYLGFGNSLNKSIRHTKINLEDFKQWLFLSANKYKKEELLLILRNFIKKPNIFGYQSSVLSIFLYKNLTNDSSKQNRFQIILDKIMLYRLNKNILSDGVVYSLASRFLGRNLYRFQNGAVNFFKRNSMPIFNQIMLRTGNIAGGISRGILSFDNTNTVNRYTIGLSALSIGIFSIGMILAFNINNIFVNIKTAYSVPIANIAAVNNNSNASTLTGNYSCPIPGNFICTQGPLGITDHGSLYTKFGIEAVDLARGPGQDTINAITDGRVEFGRILCNGFPEVHLVGNDGNTYIMEHIIPSSVTLGVVQKGISIAKLDPNPEYCPNYTLSTGEHLHLEIKDKNGKYINPFVDIINPNVWGCSLTKASSTSYCSEGDYAGI